MKRILVFLWLVVKPAVPTIAAVLAAATLLAIDVRIGLWVYGKWGTKGEAWGNFIYCSIFVLGVGGAILCCATHAGATWLRDEFPKAVSKKWQQAVDVTKRPDEVAEQETLLRASE